MGPEAADTLYLCLGTRRAYCPPQGQYDAEDGFVDVKAWLFWEKYSQWHVVSFQNVR